MYSEPMEPRCAAARIGKPQMQKLMQTGEDGLWAEDRGYLLYCRSSFPYAVILRPKVFDTQIQGKRFEMYNDTCAGTRHKSGKEKTRTVRPSPLESPPVFWLDRLRLLYT